MRGMLGALRRFTWRRRFVVTDVEGEQRLRVARFATLASAEEAASRYTTATGHATIVEGVYRLFGVVVLCRSESAYQRLLDGQGLPYIRRLSTRH